MECERFKKLLKSWYIQVQNEALAPARMVDFMENHVEGCPVCKMDPEAKKDIAKIITLVLPQEKIRQTGRQSVTEDQETMGGEGEEAGLEADYLSEGEEAMGEEPESGEDDLEDDFEEDSPEEEQGRDEE
ncbi:MAG: hypothetical protein M0Z90_07455 [Desulfobacteraceae bacterium]|nr:hypothetical protein [Desulfobacteraceae bacterium]